MIPAPALAENTAANDQVVNVGGTRYYDGAGDVVENATALGDNCVVQLSKTIEPADTENLFEITLEVVTTQVVQKVDQPAAVVLVIDNSGSMKGTRIAKAKEAAQNFVESYADAKADRYVSVVIFDAESSVKQKWTNVGNNNYDNVNNTISSIQADSGTNIQAGLQTAVDQLKDNAINGIASKYIILLSDGQPTQCGETCAHGKLEDRHCCHTGAESAAASIPQGVVKYAIYLGKSTDDIGCNDGTCSLCNDILITTWLGRGEGETNRLNFDSVKNAEDSTALNGIYQDIFKEMGLGSQAWQVADPAGPGVVFTETDENAAVDFSDEHIDWDLTVVDAVESDGTQIKTYTYTYTYDVTLNTLHGDYSADKKYPTNGTTSLTYVLRNADGEILDRDGQVVNENGNPVTDITDASSDAIKAHLRTAYFPIPEVKGYDAGMFSFTKVKADSNNDPLEGAEFTLSHDGANCGCEVSHIEWTQTSGADGTVSFENIPSGHKYTLSETRAPDGYAASDKKYRVVVSYGQTTVYDGDTQVYPAAEGSSFTVENQEKTTIDIPVNKVWVGGKNDNRPGVTVQLLANGTASGSPVTLNESNKWTHTFTDLPKYANGAEIQYTVTENTVTDYATEITFDDETSSYLITNTHSPDKINITGSKFWNDNDDQDGKRPTSVQVQLYANNTASGSPVTLNADNRWTHTFTDLPKYANGAEIQYTVTENTVTDYATEITFDDETSSYLITNTHSPDKINITGSKFWNDNDDQDGKRPESITVKLLANGTEICNKAVNKTDGWLWNFTDLPKYANGKEIVYTVTEAEIEGYTADITFDKETASYRITNTHAPETVQVSGSKTWNDGENYAGKRPGSITVNLLANGTKIRSKAVTETDGWLWNFTDLPKYANGEEIVYTVTEEAVDGYTSAVDGYNITNSYENGKLVINKTISGNNAKPGDEFTLKLTLGYDEEPMPANISVNLTNDSIFANVRDAIEGDNITFTRYDSNGNIVDSFNKSFFVSMINEYEFRLKGGEQLVVSNLPGGSPIQYKVEEVYTGGYKDTYSNEVGEVSLYGDPVSVTVNNHKHRSGGGGIIVPPTDIPQKPPKTGDISVLNYAAAAVMAALSTITTDRKK